MPFCVISELPPCELSVDFSAAHQNSGKIGLRLPPHKSQSVGSILIGSPWQALHDMSSTTDRKGVHRPATRPEDPTLTLEDVDASHQRDSVVSDGLISS